MRDSPIRVLLIEDNPGDARLIKEYLSEAKEAPFEILVTERLSDGLSVLTDRSFDLILLDLNLPDSSGIETLSKVKAEVKNTAIIVLTGLSDEEMAAEALRKGAQDYLVKDQINSDLLSRAIRYAIERKQTEEALRYRLEFEKLISDISTRFIDLTPESIDQGIEDAIEEIGKFVDADGCYVFLFSDDMNKFSMTHLWHNGILTTLKSDLQNLNVSSMPWWTGKLTKQEPVVVSSTDDLPTEAAIEKSILKPQGIQSLVDVPMIYLGKIIGFLGLSCVRTKRRWMDDEVSLLKMIGQIITNALQRKRIEKEREQLQEQIYQSQKMEAMGTLAGGIAHDFNNILSAIIGYTELSQMKLPEDSEVLSNLNEIFNAGNRAKELVQQILTFSRQTKQELKPVQLKAIAKEVLKLLRASLPSTIEIHHDLESDLLVMGDPTQIHQILMNLCTNAGYAMRQNGGSLKISLNNVAFDANITSKHPDLKAGPYIKLSVQDTGQGIPSDVLDRIFDPFFTTKEKGDGTGMGLAVVHGIVKSYGGIIDVYSKPEKGSVFLVFLPAVERRIAPDTRKEKPIPKGTERILFVDDEEALSKAGKKSLESLGYDVKAKTSSTEALAFFKDQPDKFDLVITDMTMPNMTGDKLAKEIIAIRPDIPIILCSGYSAKITEEKVNKMDIKDFLTKPIAIHDLAESVRNVLDQRPQL